LGSWAVQTWGTGTWVGWEIHSWVWVVMAASIWEAEGEKVLAVLGGRAWAALGMKNQSWEVSEVRAWESWGTQTWGTGTLEDLGLHSWALVPRGTWEVSALGTPAAVVLEVVVAGETMASEVWAVEAARAWVVLEERRRAVQVWVVLAA